MGLFLGTGEYQSINARDAAILPVLEEKNFCQIRQGYVEMWKGTIYTAERLAMSLCHTRVIRMAHCVIVFCILQFD